MRSHIAFIDYLISVYKCKNACDSNFNVVTNVVTNFNAVTLVESLSRII